MSSFHLFKKLIPYFYRYRWSYIFGLIFILFHNYGYVKLTESIKNSLAYITLVNDARTIYYLMITAGYLFFTVFFMYLMRFYIIGNSRKIEYNLRKDLFDRLLDLPISFYKKEETGDLVSRITNDLNDIRTLLGPGVMFIPNSLSRLAFFIPVMFSISFDLMLLLLLQMTFLIIMIFYLIPKLRPYYNRIQKSRASINNKAWQMIFGIATIKLNTMEENQTEDFAKVNENYLKENLALSKIQEFTWPFFFFFFSCSEILILIVGGKQIITGQLTPEELLQFSVMVGVMTFPIFSLGWVMSIIQQGITAQKRINKFFDYPFNNFKKRNLSLKKLQTLKVPYKIEFKQVSFVDENKNKILNQISFKVSQGEILGLTGSIGSGKTLLLNLLIKMASPTSGKILLNGVDIQKIPDSVYYGIIAAVPQETFLFSMPLKNNLGFEKGENPILEKVINSAKIASLDQEIVKFKNQYDEIIGERGITLSGGQKQRTSIGRAIYKEARILIMDDALSSIDSQTEENILNNFKKLKLLKSIIFSSHKISFLRQADKVIFLNNGKIIEQGSHTNLVKKKGAYYNLVKLQQLKNIIN